MDPVVILGTDVVSVGPGQERRVPVRVRNQGRRVESYIVDVLGGAAPFAEVTPSTVSVLPGREAEVDVTFRPPGGSSTPAGTLAFAVRATSQVDASSSAVAEGRLELAGVAGLQAWAQETTRAGRWSTRYHLEFSNQGNASVRLAVMAHDPAGMTRLKLDPDVVDLAPGGRVTSTLHARSRQPFLRGSVVNRNLQASCQTYAFGSPRPVPGGVPPTDDPNHRTFQLSFQQRPILPKFLIPLIAVAVAAALVLAVVTLRKPTATSLTTTNPLAPSDVNVTTGGADSLIVAWQPVPNALGYAVEEFDQKSNRGLGTIKDKLPPDQLQVTVDSLLPGSQHCYAVKALGPDGQDSSLNGNCAATSPPTALQKPTNVAVTLQDNDNYEVSWDFDGAGITGVSFVVLVGGVPGTPTTALSEVIPLAKEAQPRVVNISVQAQADKDVATSDPKLVHIDALPAETTTAPPTTTLPPTTSAAPTTAVGVVPPPPPNGTDDATSTTTTVAETTTSTIPAVVATAELQNFTPRWAAVLDAVLGEPGPATQVRLEKLAKRFNVPIEQIKMFTNRDTVARRSDGKPVPLNSPATLPDFRFAYVVTGDEAKATEVCAKDSDNLNSCQVLELAGAAKAAGQLPVLVLSRLPAESTLAEVDAALKAERTALTGRRVYVADGRGYPALGASGPVIFVSASADQTELANLCTQAKIDPCTPTTLG